MDNLTVVIPFYQGHDTIERLVRTIPFETPVLLIDDMSDPPLTRQSWMRENVKILRLTSKGYFSGAVNVGLRSCSTDVLVLNQDVWFEDDTWQVLLKLHRNRYAMIGERIAGEHPAFGGFGYIHGTFMFMRRDAVETVGPLNAKDYPLWGSTAEWQWRVIRKGFEAYPVSLIPGFRHEREYGERYGSSIRKLLMDEPKKESWLIQTPPLLSVIVPCYNYGRYLADCINSLIGGPTSLGMMPGQTLQSFEIIIIDDASTDDTPEVMERLVDIKKGIRGWRREQNGGTAKTLNYGIERAVGKYITFLSADDMREQESLERLVRACQKNPHSFAYDNIWLFHTNKRIKKWRMEEYDFDTLIYKNQVHAGIVFPKAAWREVGGYPDIMDNGREDWAFNVALGVKGWCGVHVDDYGYLYRRENQNRSLTNTSPEHHRKFLAKISGLFPEIYRGERPMACCGRKNRDTSSRTSAPTNRGMISPAAKRSLTINGSSGGFMAPTVGAGGMVLLVYMGRGMTSVWDGPVTNTRYRFGQDGNTRGWVDKRDAGEKGKSGFLNEKDSKGNYLFDLDQTALVADDVVDGGMVRTVETVTKQETQTKEVVAEGVVITPEPAGASQGAGTATQEVAPQQVAYADPIQRDPKVVVGEAVPDFPNPDDYNATEIRSLVLSKAQWEQVYKAELASKNRKTVVTFIEEQLGKTDESGA